MKRMKLTVQIVFLSMMMFIVQGYSCIVDLHHGPKEKEIRKVSGFEAIEVSHGIDVYLTMGSSELVEVETSEDLLEHLITEVKGKTLKIYFDKSFNWNDETTVWIQAREINGINASGGADVIGEDVVETRELELNASGGSDIKLEVNTGRIEAEVSGGADIKLSGFTEMLVVNTSGGSDFNSYELTARRADLEASGGSDIKVTVEEELDARASGGADIYYKGDPTNVNSDSSSGGDVSHRN